MEHRRAQASRTATRMSAGFLVLLVMTGIAGAAYLYQLKGSAAVQHTVEVDGSLARVFSTIQDAETGQRGYLLTGEVSFLEPYARSAPAIAGRIAALQVLMQDNAAQLARLHRLEALIGEKLSELKATIDLKRSGEDDRARALVASGAGKRIMDRIHQVVREMEEQEGTLLTERHASVTRIASTIWAAAAAIVALLVAISVSGIREARRRESLSRFLPAEVADRLADGDDDLRSGRRQDAAIVFIDLRGSTTLAEGLDPQALSVFLGAFRRHVTDAARRHDGVIDKFLGDGALVVFGLPDAHANDAARALAFAQDLVAAIDRWNTARGDGRTVRIGVGIHYGVVFCGIIGREERLEFTVLGDVVNVAARLEQATKVHGVAILASQAACAAAGEAARDWREVGREPLRGRCEAMPYRTPPSASRPSAAASPQASAATASGGALRET